jgi:hypothetical protein
VFCRVWTDVKVGGGMGWLCAYGDCCGLTTSLTDDRAGEGGTRHDVAISEGSLQRVVIREWKQGDTERRSVCLQEETLCPRFRHDEFRGRRGRRLLRNLRAIATVWSMSHLG